MRRALPIACALLFIFVLTARASPGGTDGNGGHYDSRTGEYHYHHGYPAHQHICGVCPYDPGFTSFVVTGGDETAARGSSEDADDVARGSAKIAAPFSGIPRRGGFAVALSAGALALLSLCGFLSTVRRQK